MTASANPDPDPGAQPTLESKAAGLERERLFRIIETETILIQRLRN